MNHQDLINTCVFEQFQVLLFSDLSGPLRKPVLILHYNLGQIRQKIPISIGLQE